MSKRLSVLFAGLAVAGSLGFAGQAASADAPAAPHHDSCFLSRDWEGWKSPNPNVIYVRVGVSRIYQLDLAAGSNQLQTERERSILAFARLSKTGEGQSRPVSSLFALQHTVGSV